MVRFNNLKVGTRLTLAFVALVAMMLTIALVAASQMKEMHDASVLIVSNRFPKTVMMNSIINDIHATGRLARDMALAGDASRVREASSELDAATKRNDERFEVLKKTVVLTPTGKKGVEDSLAARATFLDAANEFRRLLAGGKADDAKSILQARLRSSETAYAAAVEDMLKHQQAYMEKSASTEGEQFTGALTVLFGLSALTALLACAFAYMITRSVTRPLGRAVAIAQSVAAGDLTSTIDVTSTAASIGSWKRVVKM